MKKPISILLIILIIFNLTLCIGFAGDVDSSTYDRVKIINPTSNIIYSDYLLISVKTKEDTKFKFSLYSDIKEDALENITICSVTSASAITTTPSDEEKETFTDSNLIYGPMKIETSGVFNFYTVQLENLVPGKYKICIQVLDDKQGVEHTINKTFTIKEKSAMPEDTADPNMFTEKPNNGIQVIQNIIKNIFGN